MMVIWRGLKRKIQAWGYCFSTGLSVSYRWPGANHKSLLGYRSADRYVGISFLMRTKKRLDVYIDESGNFAPFSPHNRIYSVSFVFVEPSVEVEEQKALFHHNISKLSGGEFFVHVGNLVRGKLPYEGMLLEDRQRLFYGLFMFAKRTPLSLYSFHVKKSETDTSKLNLSDKIAREMKRMILAFGDYFSEYERIVVHYDNGQTDLGLIIQSSFISGLPGDVVFEETFQEQEPLMQVADLICYLESLYYKIDERSPTNSDFNFFGRTKTDIDRKYLNPLRKKQLK